MPPNNGIQIDPTKLKNGQFKLQMQQGKLVLVPDDSGASSKEQQREELKKVYKETKNLLPGLLATRPDAPPEGYRYSEDDLKYLKQSKCPRLSPVRISVVNDDSLDAAIDITRRHKSINSSNPVGVLNMANAYSAGGGAANGAMAQEESMCYRSSLLFTLKLRYYPLPPKGGIYSPTVLVIRHGLDKDHRLAQLSRPDRLPVVSVASMAAIQNPSLVKNSSGRYVYKHDEDRSLMKSKMRRILRMMAINGRRRIVLGAFGCGAFNNPRAEVANMWKEVLGETEFRGWFEEIVFAVLDKNNANGNYEAFRKVLDGVPV